MSERNRDEMLKDSFPASEPSVTDAGRPDKRSIDEVPTRTPNSDRHSTETAHHREDENKPKKD
jgi:hypothetical protein